MYGRLGCRDAWGITCYQSCSSSLSSTTASIKLHNMPRKKKAKEEEVFHVGKNLFAYSLPLVLERKSQRSSRRHASVMKVNG